ncbi:MAG TPA: hypothetical protein VK400_18780, partial [Pyrinomonadaceae bacterium]|nr:hypothetical protein [Pyrinomonadaceae bacterium]
CLSCLSLLIFLFCACQKNNNSESSGIDVFGLTDETAEAAAVVQDANEDLKKIRKMYKENQSRIDELKTATQDKKIDEAKKIADELVYIINDGFVLGESAVAKIEKAEAMNTNEKYREYLQLKKGSLKKQLDAFEFRRQAAQLLRDAFGNKDKLEIERAKAEFREKEENFQKYMEIAREMSGEANQLAKEALQRQ